MKAFPPLTADSSSSAAAGWSIGAARVWGPAAGMAACDGSTPPAAPAATTTTAAAATATPSATTAAATTVPGIP